MSEPRMLHRSAPVVEIVDVRKVALAGLPGFVASREEGLPWWAVVALLAFLVLVGFGLTYMQYRRFRYSVEGESLVVWGGILFHWRRVVPFARVQSVDVVRRLRHRVFGVVELRIEAIGGSKTEASFSALKPAEAERIRLTVLRGSRDAPTDAEIAGDREGKPWWDDRPATEVPSEPPLATMSPKDLLVYGATGGRNAFIALLLVQALEFLPFESLADAARGAPIGLVTASVLGVLVVSTTISLAMTVVTFWDFALYREGDRIVVSRGLLEHRRQVVPLHRVQAVRMQENLLRRVLGYASLRVLVAGQVGGDSSERQERSVLLPIGARDEVLRLVSGVLGADLAEEASRLEGVPARALVRSLAWLGLLVAVATAIALVAWDTWAGVLLLLVAAWVAWLAWRARGLRLGPDHVLTRSGPFTRETSFVPYENVQHVSRHIGPLQRALGLASLRFALVKGSAMIQDLDASRAEEVFTQVSERVLRTHWRAAS